MLLRSHHIRESFVRIRRRPSSRSQDSVDRVHDAFETHHSPTGLESNQQARIARSSFKASHPTEEPIILVASPPPVDQRTDKPDQASPSPSILRKSRLFSFRRTMSRKTVRFEPTPQPKRKEKQVRFSLPDKTVSVRPAQSVSTHTDRKRSSTVHPRAETRSSKRARYPEPVFVAPGLSTATRTREAERPREMANAKARAWTSQRRSSLPFAAGAATGAAAVLASHNSPAPPRRERRSYTAYAPNKLSTQLRPTEVLGNGYDWARVRRRTVYGWYN